MALRQSRAAGMCSPRLYAFALPKGAPVDLPPCIRQQPLAIAGLRHAAFERVCALQRVAASIGAVFRGCDPAFFRGFLLCMGLNFHFREIFS
jgi:hypothetical protein